MRDLMIMSLDNSRTTIDNWLIEHDCVQKVLYDADQSFKLNILVKDDINDKIYETYLIESDSIENGNKNTRLVFTIQGIEYTIDHKVSWILSEERDDRRKKYKSILVDGEEVGQITVGGYSLQNNPGFELWDIHASESLGVPIIIKDREKDKSGEWLPPVFFPFWWANLRITDPNDIINDGNPELTLPERSKWISNLNYENWRMGDYVPGASAVGYRVGSVVIMEPLSVTDYYKKQHNPPGGGYF